MDYFLWSTCGDVDDETLVFIEDAPHGMGLLSYKLSMGEPAQKDVPKDARIKIREENMGAVLPGFIGNTNQFLILSRAGVDVLTNFCDSNKMEIFPIRLFKPDGEFLSEDYSIVNPLEKVECLAKNASGLKVDKKGRFISVKEYVLLQPKLENAPHLFRLEEDPQAYIFSRALGRALNEARVTNILGTRIEVIGQDL